LNTTDVIRVVRTFISLFNFFFVYSVDVVQKSIDVVKMSVDVVKMYVDVAKDAKQKQNTTPSEQFQNPKLNRRKMQN
jgi:hypothetical protein